MEDSITIISQIESILGNATTEHQQAILYLCGAFLICLFAYTFLKLFYLIFKNICKF